MPSAVKKRPIGDVLKTEDSTEATGESGPDKEPLRAEGSNGNAKGMKEEDVSGQLFLETVDPDKTKSSAKAMNNGDIQPRTNEDVNSLMNNAAPRLEDEIDLEEEEDDDSERSEEIIVMAKVADRKREAAVVRAKLNRTGFRHRLWRGTLGSYFVFFAFLGGYDSMANFSYYVSQYGMGFVLVYMLSLLCFGLPLTFMELALGQYTTSGAVAVYSRIAPAFNGIGYVALALNFLYFLTDQLHVVYFMDLYFNTVNFFTSQKPWNNCVSSYNDIYCRDPTHSCVQHNYDNLPTELADLFKYTTVGSFCYRSLSQFAKKDAVGEWTLNDIGTVPLNEWMTAESMGQHIFWNVNVTHERIQYKALPSSTYLVYYFLALFIILFICYLGNRAITLISTTNGVVTFAALTSIFVWMVFLSPPEFMYQHYLQKEIAEYFKDKDSAIRVISSAVLVTLTTLRLGQGGLIYFGSQHSFSNSLVIDSLIYTIMAGLPLFVYSFLHFYAIHSYTMSLNGGDMTAWRQTALNVLNPVESYFYAAGSRLVQLTFFLQSLRAWTATEPLLICIFSCMVLLMTIANKVIRAEIIISGLFEAIPVLARTYTTSSRMLVMYGFLCSAYLVMFCFMTETGLDILVGLENLTLPAVTISVVLCELIVIGWCYGARRLMANIMAMHAGRTRQLPKINYINMLGAFVALIWKFFTPSFIVGCIAIKIIAGHSEGGHGFRTKLTKVTDVNVLLFFISLVVIVGWVVKQVLQDRRDKLALSASFKPDADLWGPCEQEDRIFSVRIEKKMRI